MNKEALKHTDLMLSFEFNNTKANLYWNGGPMVSYELLYKNYSEAKTYVTLAYGNDFKPSPLHNIYDTQTMVSFLSFMCVNFGDTDKEYFIRHTPEHTQWLQTTDRDEINMYAGDFDFKESEYYAEAVKFFENHTKKH